MMDFIHFNWKTMLELSIMSISNLKSENSKLQSSAARLVQSPQLVSKKSAVSVSSESLMLQGNSLFQRKHTSCYA